MNVFEYVFTSIHGAPMPLRNWTGQPMFLVNTASECGYTPQYAKLQKLWNDYHESSLMVIGIPSDDFGHQEPGDEEEISEFCSREFGIKFPMTSKQSVMGYSAHPFFQALREAYGDDVTPRWNFHKYLFNRQGEMVGNWPSSVEPDDPAVTHQIERYLQSWIL